MSPEDILRKYWGHESFRPLQKEIIQSVLDGKDTLALLPTGGGKSVCYQVPALMKGGLTLVISPLIALMKDQVENLRSRGIKAVAVNSTLSRQEMELHINNCIHGDTRLLYLSPERLENREFSESLTHMPLSLIAVDEAHCVSQWGYDFRPPYLRIALVRKLFPEVPVLALTATATAEVVDDIQMRLEFRKKHVIRASFRRENLIYFVFSEEDKRGRLLRLFSRTEGTAVVYVRSRRKTQEIAAFLKSQGISADYYHAGLEPVVRTKKQDGWMKGAFRVMVATNAFGMGIDKPDVRLVVHLDLPDSLEAYFQEAGRAGRDGKKAYAVVLYDQADLEALDSNLLQSYPEPGEIRKVYHALGNHFRLPVGSGRDACFDFDLKAFSEQYHFNMIKAFNSLEFLGKEGYIMMLQEPEASSRLMMTSSQEALHFFMAEEKRYEELIRVLLRSYGGLFTDYTAVNEREIAKRAGMSHEECIKALSYITKLGLADYIPRKGDPRIIFCRERLDTSHILISPENYGMRKEAALRRVKAVKQYAGETKTCRSQLLLQYFNEQESKSCEACDNCLKNKKAAGREPGMAGLLIALREMLERQAMTDHSILAEFESTKQEMVLECLRFLLDQGEITRNRQGLLKKKKR